MAQVVHETISYAIHLQDTLGTPLHRYFLSHPMKSHHSTVDMGIKCTTHHFNLRGPQLDLKILVQDGDNTTKGFVMVMPQSDFCGAVIQASQKDQYIVRFERSLSRPQGKLAKQHVEEFVSKYGAIDTGI